MIRIIATLVLCMYVWYVQYVQYMYVCMQKWLEFPFICTHWMLKSIKSSSVCMYLYTLRAPAAALADDSDGGDKSSVLVKLDVEVAGEF